jgi:hypothetical protein
MPLIVEDGSGIANADTFVTLDDADAFFSDRNEGEWAAASNTVREAALRQAATYLGMVYRWPGQATKVDQALPWPRYGVPSGGGFFPSNEIPRQVNDAQLLLALEVINRGTILRRVDPAAQVIEKTIAAKGMSRTLKYATAPVDDVSELPRFVIVDNILRGVALGNTGGDFASVPLVRV